MANIRSYRDLKVWQNAIDAAMELFEISKLFPPEEKYSLTDQIRRSSRSVAANIAEAWRRRRYEAAFRSKLNDCEAGPVKPRPGSKSPVDAAILNDDTAARLDQHYEHIIGKLVVMIRDSNNWSLRPRDGE